MSLTVFTKRNFVADFLEAKCDFTPKTAFLHFLLTTYDDHLRLIGKRVARSGFRMLIELFSLGVTAVAVRANIGSKSAISLQRGRLTQNFR